MNPDIDTEPLPLLAVTASLMLGAYVGEWVPRPCPRHAARTRRAADPDLIGLGAALLGCAAGAAAAAAWVGLTWWAVAAWACGGATALALAGTHRDPSGIHRPPK